ncbi:hypothetical protein ACFHW2_09495 [Actinomadura sp. LOL_016]|uniref:hypothetical protein n=1 Tax=unclassified Actinomadura TaxID=2626254 RepID=UPI003A80DA66
MTSIGTSPNSPPHARTHREPAKWIFVSQIGRSALGDPEYWQGFIDDIKVFQGALTEEEIFTPPYP